MTARNNSKSVTFFKSVSQFDNVLRVSQMLITEKTPSSIIYRELVSVLPSLPGSGFRIPDPSFSIRPEDMVQNLRVSRIIR